MDTFFHDVGQGDCTHIEAGEPSTDNWQIFLIDFGFKPGDYPGESPSQSTLIVLVDRITEISIERGKNKPYLDHLFITHSDGDHWNMLANLVTGTDENGDNLWEAKWPDDTTLEIGKITYGGEESEYRNKGYGWDTIKNACRTPVLPLGPAAHDEMLIDETVTPSWPYLNGELKIYLIGANIPTRASRDPNLKSVMLLIEFKGRKLILLGDGEAGKFYENYLEGWYPEDSNFLNCTAVKLGHHGSRSGTTDAWATATKPEAAFVSSGYGYSHPYCVAIRAIRSAGTIKNAFYHWLTCSDGLNHPYGQQNTQENIFSNLWYVVTDREVSAENNAGKIKKKSYGMFVGVTYLMQWFDDPNDDSFAFSPFDNVWPGQNKPITIL